MVNRVIVTYNTIHVARRLAVADAALEVAYLSDPPSAGVRILEAAGVAVHAV